MPEKMDEKTFASKVHELAEELGVPGVSAGVLIDGEEHYAYSGVTSVDCPLAVDETTLFQFGSTGKTFTATAIMRLVELGKVRLDDKVRDHVPELVLKDEQTAAEVTVLHLLNHTAGWDGDFMENTGDGDDALEKYVALMAGIDQVSPLGSSVSYNNASLSLAGRLIEKVTGQVYEKAMADLLLKPLGLNNTFYFRDEIMTRRFAVGHQIKPGETEPRVSRPWGLPRSGAPAGGAVANAHDQIAWARFHLGDGTAPDGSRFLATDLLKSMQEPTADMSGSALGDAVGISWLLGQRQGAKTVSHGGTMIGQHSSFVMVPEHGFAVICMSNSGPNGSQLNDQVVEYALEAYLGIKEEEPTVASLSDEELAAYAGSFETIAAIIDIVPKDGQLEATLTVKPEMAKVLAEAGEEVDEQPPVPLGLIEGQPDRYVVPSGEAKGMKGYFARNDAGEVEGVHLGGRLATRVAAGTAQAAEALTSA